MNVTILHGYRSRRTGRSTRARSGSMIGRRLRVARAAAGLSLRALEARIGRRVTAQAISEYERDEAVPDSGVLLALAAEGHPAGRIVPDDPDWEHST